MASTSIFPTLDKTVSAVYIALIASMGLGIVSLGSLGGGNIRLWQLCLIIYLVLQLIRNSISGRMALKLSVPIFLAIGYFITIVLSGLNAIDHELWFKRVVLSASFLLLFITISQGMQSKKAVPISNVIIFSGILFSILGILDLYFYNYNRQIFDIIHSFDSSNVDGQATLAGYGVITRARGFANEANEFSQYLIIPFGFILAELAFTRRNKLVTFFYILALAVVLLAQLASLSRGGLLGFLAQIVALYFIKSKYEKIHNQRKHYFTVITLITIVIAILWFFVQAIFEENLIAIVLERVVSTNTSGDWTADARLATIYAGLESVQGGIANFLVGIGAGNLDVSQVGEATTTNQFVDILVETGIVGILLFLILIAYLLFIFAKSITVSLLYLPSKSLTIFVGCYLSFIGMLVGGLTYATHSLFTFWFIAGLLTSVIKLRSLFKN